MMIVFVEAPGYTGSVNKWEIQAYRKYPGDGEIKRVQGKYRDIPVKSTENTGEYSEHVKKIHWKQRGVSTKDTKGI